MKTTFDIDISSSVDDSGDNVINRTKIEQSFDSESALGTSFSLEPGATSDVANYSVPLVLGNQATLEKVGSSSYRVFFDNGTFNPNKPAGLSTSSVITVSSENGILTVSSPDFDLSNVNAGDRFIMHKEDNSVFAAESQGHVFTITGVDQANKKIVAANEIGAPSQTVTLSNLDFFSIFENLITDSHTLKLGDGFFEQNQGLHDIILATDRYIEFSASEIVDETITVLPNSISVFSKVITSLSLVASGSFDLLIDGVPVTVALIGPSAIFAATLKCSSLQARNLGTQTVTVTAAHTTSSHSSSGCGR